MHPQLKPRDIAKANHVWCLTSELPANQKVSLTALKPLADSLSKTMEMPVSVFADEQKISLASFWDHRSLGASKLFSSDVNDALRQKNISQSIELAIRTSFTCEEALAGDDDGSDYDQEEVKNE